MAKNHNHSYADSSTQRCGLMKCAICGKQIESGQFRYRMAFDKWFNDTGFVTSHRACTENDPAWAKLDAEAAANKEHRAAKLTACIAFREQLGVTDLDELIAALKESK